MTQAGYTHLHLLADRSGSIDKIKTDIEGGIQTLVDEQKKVTTGECTFSMDQFDDVFDTVLHPQPINTVGDIKLVPRNMTALQDAMVRSIGQLGAWLRGLHEDQRPENVVFIIATDGLENASREYSGPDGARRVRELVDQQRNQWKWQFIFLGANQDAWAVGQSYGMQRGQTVSYSATAASVGNTYSAVSESLTDLRTKGAPLTVPEDLTEDAGSTPKK